MSRLAILAALVFETPCGKTDRHTNAVKTNDIMGNYTMETV